MKQLPEKFIQEIFNERKHMATKIMQAGNLDEVQNLLIKNSYLLSPIVATCGPAGPNAAPFMVSFVPRPEKLDTMIQQLRSMREQLWGKGGKAMSEALQWIVSHVYNLDNIDPHYLASHMMSRGHTWINILSTGKATLAFLIPPDRGAYEVRTTAWIEEKGPIYEYVNLLHDLMHAVPHGESSHPWYPAVIFKIEEIYDNSYQQLGTRIY
ncbi:MAG: hypothetical protein F7C32_03950 [Desulfurococcales archaeon]|nr:hypothetical protein [Desulfurococcales archaeon]